MDNSVDAAIQDLNQAVDQLIGVFEKTPEDRVNWSPTVTSRTPVQLVVHSANSIGFIGAMLMGTPYPAKTMAEADAEFLVLEKKITTREEALQLLKAKRDAYIAILGSLTSDQLESIVTAPFGLGSVPMSLAITFGAAHTRGHMYQLEYLQTIYGDREW